MQAEPQPGEPGYRTPYAKSERVRVLVEKGVVKSPFADDNPEVKDPKTAAYLRQSGRDARGIPVKVEGAVEDIPEAAKKPMRTPMAAVGKPKIVQKRPSSAAYNQPEETELQQVKTFAEVRGKMPVKEGNAQQRTMSAQTRRSILDTGAPLRFPGLPEYLQPLMEDTREQREKLRMRIPMRKSK